MEHNLNFKLCVHITGLSFKAYHMQLIYLRKLAFEKNRKVEVEWVIWKFDQICFLKVRHLLSNGPFLPLFWTLPVSSCVIYLDDLLIRQLFPIALCYLASNISSVFCMIRLTGNKTQCACLLGHFFLSKWFTNWHPLILSLVLSSGPSYPSVMK